MKKLTLTLSALALAFTVSTFAADAKEQTIKGKGQCAKCSLKEADSCQNAIVTEKDGKKTTYYIAQNDTSKKFHGKICTEPKDVEATGTVKEENGKKTLTVSKIDLAAAK
ncbi:MAG TPA: DUF6370 family protein [Methylomirabilota bacterium]|nr:DUF6370 family protein [Methylomirabilota bacterium]